MRVSLISSCEPETYSALTQRSLNSRRAATSGRHTRLHLGQRVSITRIWSIYRLIRRLRAVSRSALCRCHSATHDLVKMLPIAGVNAFCVPWENEICSAEMSEEWTTAGSVTMSAFVSLTVESVSRATEVAPQTLRNYQLLFPR